MKTNILLSCVLLMTGGLSNAAPPNEIGIKTRKNDEGMTLAIFEDPTFNFFMPKGWFTRRAHISNLNRWEFSKENPDLPEGRPWKTGMVLDIMEQTTTRLGKTPEEFAKEALKDAENAGQVKNPTHQTEGLPQGSGYGQITFENPGENPGSTRYRKIIWNNKLDILIMIRADCLDSDKAKWLPIFRQMHPL
jgi:hypothetical protein